MHKIILLIALVIMSPLIIFAQGDANYDESKVPDYTLPDLLISETGKRISSAKEWNEIRRPEILELFETQVYGRVPKRNIKVEHEVLTINDQSLNGLATQKQIRINFHSGGKQHDMILLIYIPNNAEKPVPAFLGLNFKGNHTISDDPAIIITDSWIENDRETGIINNSASEAPRGLKAGRWPVELIINRGYALASIYYGDIDPDFDDGFSNGIHALFKENQNDKPEPDEWGSIAAWAWGLSRALDYLETEPFIDHSKVGVIGHSRLGKTALWAGAADTRFAMVISNNSGCGGAALSRREFGEKVIRINTVFPHWFCDNYVQWNNRINESPVDQHQLIALIAPRPVYVASAEDDRWADPRGEFLACLHAEVIYRLFGTDGLPVKEMPLVDDPVTSGTIGYHIRSGEHDLTVYDWEQYLDFADRHMK